MVIDTSAVVAVLLEEPKRPALIRATTGVVLFAPGSLPWEVGNALVALTRRRRLTVTEAQQAWAAYEAVPLRLVDMDVERAIALAVEHGLYAYDGYMLLLARDRALPLLTLDGRLAMAARRAGITVVEV